MKGFVQKKVKLSQYNLFLCSVKTYCARGIVAFSQGHYMMLGLCG